VVLWFAACDFPSSDSRHTLHEATSQDGRTWTPPSRALLAHTYAPTIIKQDGVYRMWYTDVREDPWPLRYAESNDGYQWDVASGSILVMDQEWEHGRLFYPTVLMRDGMQLMRYGSYKEGRDGDMKTALGFALSEDGRTWRKHPGNPVFGPDPSVD
jgi:hypothetical protein